MEERVNEMGLVWCIVCGRWVVVELLLFKGSSALAHNKDGDRYLSRATEVCFGAFAHCPPPEVTEEQWKMIMEDENV